LPALLQSWQAGRRNASASLRALQACGQKVVTSQRVDKQEKGQSVKFTAKEETNPAGTTWYEFEAFADEFGSTFDEHLQWCEDNWEGEPTQDWEYSLHEMFAREYGVERGGGVTPIGGLEPIHWMFTIRTRHVEDAIVFKLKFC
jgi:hypothetical protein